MTNEEKINKLCDIIETLVQTMCNEARRCDTCVLQCYGKQAVIDALTEIKETEA
jgi:hypothetical protein